MVSRFFDDAQERVVNAADLVLRGRRFGDADGLTEFTSETPSDNDSDELSDLQNEMIELLAEAFKNQTPLPTGFFNRIGGTTGIQSRTGELSFEDFITAIMGITGDTRAEVTGKTPGEIGGVSFTKSSRLGKIVTGTGITPPPQTALELENERLAEGGTREGQPGFIGPIGPVTRPPTEFEQTRANLFPITARGTGQIEPQFTGSEAFLGNLRSDPFEFQESGEFFDQPPASPLLRQEFLPQNQTIDDTPTASEAFLTSDRGQRGLFQSALSSARLTPNQNDFFKNQRTNITNQFLANQADFVTGGGDIADAPQFQPFIEDFNFQETFQNLTPDQRQVGVSGPRAGSFNPRVTFGNR